MVFLTFFINISVEKPQFFFSDCQMVHDWHLSPSAKRGQCSGFNLFTAHVLENNDNEQLSWGSFIRREWAQSWSDDANVSFSFQEL